MITVHQGRGGGGGTLFPYSEFQKPIILCILLLQRKPCCFWYFTIVFALFFVTVVAVSRPCRFSEFYLKRASMALHCITSTTNLAPPPLLPISHSSSHLAYIAGRILVPGYFLGNHAKRSDQRNRKGKYIHLTLSPLFCAALPSKQYSTPTLNRPATQATCSSHPSTFTPYHYPHPSLTSFTPN